jgi:hypothetical protein
VAEFKNLEMTLPNKIYVRGEIKSRLIWADAHFRSHNSNMSSHCLFKNVQPKKDEVTGDRRKVKLRRFVICSSQQMLLR